MGIIQAAGPGTDDRHTYGYRVDIHDNELIPPWQLYALARYRVAFPRPTLAWGVSVAQTKEPCPPASRLPAMSTLTKPILTGYLELISLWDNSHDRLRDALTDMVYIVVLTMNRPGPWSIVISNWTPPFTPRSSGTREAVDGH